MVGLCVLCVCGLQALEQALEKREQMRLDERKGRVAAEKVSMKRVVREHPRCHSTLCRFRRNCAA